MSEAGVMNTDLDRLAERVEKAARLVQQLREDRSSLEERCTEMTARLQEAERKLQGQDVAALMQEVATLRRAERDWQAERREVAGRIEQLLRMLERLDSG